MPSPPFSLDSDEDSMRRFIVGCIVKSFIRGPVAVSSNASASASDSKAPRRVTTTPFAQSSKPVPPKPLGSRCPPSRRPSLPPQQHPPSPPPSRLPQQPQRRPQTGNPAPAHSPSRNLHIVFNTSPRQLANARAKAVACRASRAGELAFNKEKLLQQLQNQQMIQAKEAQKAADKMAAMGGGVTEEMKNDMMANAIVIPATQGICYPVFFTPGSPNPVFWVPPTLQPPAFALAMSAAQGMASPFPSNVGGGGMTTTMMMIDDDDVELDNTKPRYRLGSMRVADPETGDKKYEYKNANGLKYHLNHNLNGLKYHIIHSHTAILPNTGDILRRLEGGRR
ncbi:hypothetical protein BC829DRAFT_390113 [Chytridium lagenaria]|nr:hypothetical protein BC829DRAFT_390113 [Chytridium lagenaria]